MQNEFREIYARFIYEKKTKQLSNMKNVQKKEIPKSNKRRWDS